MAKTAGLDVFSLFWQSQQEVVVIFLQISKEQKRRKPNALLPI